LEILHCFVTLFSFWWSYVGLNSEPDACWTGVLPLEPLYLPGAFFLMLFSLQLLIVSSLQCYFLIFLIGWIVDLMESLLNVHTKYNIFVFLIEALYQISEILHIGTLKQLEWTLKKANIQRRGLPGWERNRSI
jgi:hypothetical protein